MYTPAQPAPYRNTGAGGLGGGGAQWFRLTALPLEARLPAVSGSEALPPSPLSERRHPPHCFERLTASAAALSNSLKLAKAQTSLPIHTSSLSSSTAKHKRATASRQIGKWS